MTPIVVIVRDPDYSNFVEVFDGEVEIHDIDLGNADLTDDNEWLSWAASHLSYAKAIADEHPKAADHIRDAVWSSVENLHWVGDHEELNVAELDDDKLIALAEERGLL